MSGHSTHAEDLSPAAYRHEIGGYIRGFVFAIILTVVPFAMVSAGVSTRTAMITIAILGLIQIAVHVRYFLHVDLSPEKREDLHLLVFSGLLLFLMAAGTIWVVNNMDNRMMEGVSMPGMTTDTGSPMPGMKMDGTGMRDSKAAGDTF